MNKKVLITGGSSGIGLETAKIFAAKGFDIFITSLDEKELSLAISEIKPINSSIKVLSAIVDFSYQEKSESFLNQIDKEFPCPDVVINNAGFGTYGFINDISLQREEQMIQLLIQHVHRTTRHFLKEMISRNHGAIINISSISAFQPNPTLATYGACKSFVYHWTRAINEELKDKNSKVRCIAICPTPVKTGFQENAGMQKSKLFNSWMTVDAKKVAQEIYRAYLLQKDYLIPGRFFHFLNKVVRRLPESWVLFMAKQHLKEQ